VQKSRAGQMSDAYEVIAGLHRVMAFRQLGRATIPAIVLDADDLRAESMLIDENLCRKDLSPAERIAAITRRKAIHVEIHGSPKAKGAHAAHAAMGHEHDANAESALAFTEVIAKASGRSKRAVQVDAHRGEALGEAVLAKVAGTSLDKGEELDALPKLPPETREKLIDRAEKGEKVSAKIIAKRQSGQDTKSDVNAVHVAEWRLHERTAARASLEKHKGGWWFFVRKCAEAENGEMRPTGDSIALDTRHLPDLAKAVSKAHSIVREHGLIALDHWGGK